MTSQLLQPTDAAWDANRGAYNLLLDQEPAAIAMPLDADEAAAVVRAALADGRRVAAQRTGHAAAPMGSLANTVLVRTAGLDAVEIDAGARRARVGAGALWEQVVPRASELGLAALHGSSPNVGVAGYHLGGGVGFYAREHGIACNKVTAIELIDAAGERRRVDADNDSDLFWALRGGGGSFGLLTAIEFELLELPEIFAGALFFPAERSREVLQAWRGWTETAPESITSVGRLMNFPPIPEVPEPLRGGSFAVIEAIHCGPESACGDLLAPLRELGPIMDSFAPQPPAGIAELHMDPPDPSPYLADGMMAGELTEAALDAVLAAVGPGSGSQLVSVELRHCGGALDRAGEGCGALATLPGSYLAFGVGMVPVPEAAAPVHGWLAGLRTALEPFSSGNYLNFSEQRLDFSTAFPAATVERLRQVKDAFDPEDVFQANHPVTG